MNQIGLVTGVTVGASVVLVYALLRRAIASAKSGGRNGRGGDSSSGDSCASTTGDGTGWSLWPGGSECGASDAGGSGEGGGGGDGGGD